MKPRLTLTAAVAVILASISISPVIAGVVWFWAGAAAVAVVAGAALATRLPAVQAAAAGIAVAVIACWPLFAGPAWYLRATGAAIVALTAARLARPGFLHVPAILITYLSGLLIYLNVAFSSAESAARIVPTASSLAHLWHLASQGMSEHVYAPPVPEWPGVVLLAAAGIGVMAIITDLIAVRLRSPAMAGLPLLTLYCVPITTSARQSTISSVVVFCLALTGYLAMLAADGRDRFRLWGRLVTVWQARDDEPALRPDTRALAASGRRIGFAAACLAIIIPLLVPGLHIHNLFRGHGDAGGPGGQGYAALPDPLVQLRDQLRDPVAAPVLSYRTTAQVPQDQYLQVYVLNYDAARGIWSLATPSASVPVSGGQLRPVPGLASATNAVTTTTRVTLSTHILRGYGSRYSFLPLPYAPDKVQVSGDWLEDDQTLMVYSPNATLGGLRYTAVSREAEPTSGQNLTAQIPRGIAARYLGVSPTAFHLLAGLAHRITAAATTPFGKGTALQDWFRRPGRFTYDLGAHYPNSSGGLVDFLTKGRSGYCQQFAFAMATLARLVGIPSRVAVGYTAGTSAGGGEWQVTTADAHAWPELYFANAGWLRFEPTPGSSAGGQGTAVPPDYTRSGPGGVAGQGPPNLPRTTQKGARGTGAGAHIHRPNLAPGETAAGAARPGSGSGSLPWLIVAVVAGLALIGPRVIGTLTRRRRWLLADDDAKRAHAAWREFTSDLTDYGIECRASESPRATGRRVAATLKLTGQPRDALDRLVTATERARYAASPLRAETLREDVSAIRRAIASAAGPRTRLRALLMPASALSPVRAGARQALEAFGWIDNAGLQLGARLRRRQNRRAERAWAGRAA